MHSRLPIVAGPLLVIAAIAIFWANPFGPSLTHTDEHRIRLVTIADNLDHPWGLGFPPEWRHARYRTCRAPSLDP